MCLIWRHVFVNDQMNIDEIDVKFPAEEFRQPSLRCIENAKLWRNVFEELGRPRSWIVLLSGYAPTATTTSTARFGRSRHVCACKWIPLQNAAIAC
mmetsp:Transcript_2290/g.4436  ORF Transcript_2290/g.4436 Transcript_2290/m.4436 type:complete len:96 (-) Transcript_2290:2226-2513(-)